MYTNKDSVLPFLAQFFSRDHLTIMTITPLLYARALFPMFTFSLVNANVT